jgi:ATP-dependent exoDNAse (exonuclease V) beta subunit
MIVRTPQERSRRLQHPSTHMRPNPRFTARYRRGAERALANVELFLEIARAYDARGVTAFVEALRASWEDGDKQIEGRPDSDAEAVSIITMHSAKGLEWPIVIPVNSPTDLDEKMAFLHRRSDDTVHFKLLGQASPDYELVKADERNQLRRERIRLWYVALTRACDLLLLPRQSERADADWLSLLDPRLDELPAFDALAPSVVPSTPTEETENLQDEAMWRAEAATIAAMRRTIVWRSPSRHETVVEEQPAPSEEEIFTDAAALGESLPAGARPALPRGTIQGGRERGLVLHKLLEEVLTGETAESLGALEIRARSLLAELGAAESESPADGPHPAEIATSTLRALAIPEVAALRARLLPEMTVFSAATAGDQIAFVGGVVDALALAADGAVDSVIDWKSDVDPSAAQIELYRAQVRDYLAATNATEGLLVFATSGRIERLRRPEDGPSGQGLAPAKHVRETPPCRQ